MGARSFLGAVGAIIEPLLSAFSSSQATKATLGTLSGVGSQTEQTTGIAAAEAQQLSQAMASFRVHGRAADLDEHGRFHGSDGRQAGADEKVLCQARDPESDRGGGRR